MRRLNDSRFAHLTALFAMLLILASFMAGASTAGASSAGALGASTSTTPVILLQESAGTQLVRHLENIHFLSAAFTQSAIGKETQTGQLWLKKPSKFRLESTAPLSQTIVSNGVDIWTHDRDLEQVIVANLAQRKAEIPILLFAGNPQLVLERYDIELFEDEDRQHYRLTPQVQSGLLQQVTLTFEKGLPIHLVMLSTMGERTVIELSEVSLVQQGETALLGLGQSALELFEFEAPDFVDVVDDRTVD
jgi:outer membrane lipoprotein carrier protein